MTKANEDHIEEEKKTQRFDHEQTSYAKLKASLLKKTEEKIESKAICNFEEPINQMKSDKELLTKMDRVLFMAKCNTKEKNRHNAKVANSKLSKTLQESVSHLNMRHHNMPIYPLTPSNEKYFFKVAPPQKYESFEFFKKQREYYDLGVSDYSNASSKNAVNFEKQFSCKSESAGHLLNKLVSVGNVTKRNHFSDRTCSSQEMQMNANMNNPSKKYGTMTSYNSFGHAKSLGRKHTSSKISIHMLDNEISNESPPMKKSSFHFALKDCDAMQNGKISLSIVPEFNNVIDFQYSRKNISNLTSKVQKDLKVKRHSPTKSYQTVTGHEKTPISIPKNLDKQAIDIKDANYKMKLS